MIEILFENKEVAVINKPAGMLVHDDGSGDTHTVAGWVQSQYPDVRGVGESVRVRTGEMVEKPGIAHRLDRDTTGVLIITKTQESFVSLKEQFQNHTIKKTYHAFVHGIIQETEGEIDKPIGKSRSDFRKFSAQPKARGTLRDAHTAYKVLERFPEADATFLELYPTTGRTHQIRVHLKAIHHPVVADTLYAGKRGQLLGFERTALHARAISFALLNGEQVNVEAPYPDDFEEALRQARKELR